ncbi:esterase-like activity of phytase family protein [Pseudoduganella namucuonensis]|uniref:esterase-like activity of phytase family protein n=1 Tax=Pseudoduganella namucuonensis TaxID=1035707 RepID=UPI001E38CFE6|nr:esterase-like activity of phytase family protein [Pseudoduganella namucuonensis]
MAACLLASSLAGCAGMPEAPRRGAAAHVPGASLRFIGEQRLPPRMAFMGTVVGGLSGIAYDPAGGEWVLASDDRSEHSPARYYTARLDYDARAFKAATLTGVRFFAHPDGEAPDIETVRHDPLDGGIWYASEGDRGRGWQPWVRHSGGGGSATLPVPEMFRYWPGREYGARDNRVFEGLDFAPDGASLWLAAESTLYQDGAPPTTEAGAVARITRLDRGGKVLAQYAYPLDAIPHAAAPGRPADNGIAEILALDERRLYVLERAGRQDAEGRFHFHVRLYEMDTGGATDIQRIAALSGAAYVAARKRLVLDVDRLPLARRDNLEGMAWGPRLANGHDTLVLVSDDNFSATQVTQLLLFEAMP